MGGGWAAREVHGSHVTGLEPGRGHFRTYRYAAKTKPKLV